MKKKSTAAIAVFLAPSMIVYTILVMIPVVFSVYYSFTNWNGIGQQSFIGIKNFISLFKNQDFLMSFKNTLMVTVLSIFIQIPVGLILSYLLYRGVKGFKIFRTLYFLPVVIAPIAIGLMFSLFYNSETGVLNTILRAFGLASLQKAWLSDPRVVLYSVITPQIWQFIGLYVVIFLAALQSIPEEIIESAQIEGASSVQLFFKIVCPLVWDVIQLSIILCFTGSFKSFDLSWVMTMGGPGVRSAYLGVFMFKSAFMNSNFGIGSATTVIILISGLLFTVIFNKVTSKEIY
jgi:raffinose/stachyose/melibiose transport system permease protein